MTIKPVIFARNIRSEKLEGRGVRTWPIILASLGLLILAVYWASISVLEEVTSGDGRVISSSQTQVVQVLESAIIAEVRVRAGDKVGAGQVLMRVDDTNASSQLGELKERRAALQARRSRLEAETRDFTPDFTQITAALETVAAERALYESRKIALTQEVMTAELTLSQRRQERIEADVRIRESERTLVLLDKELSLARALQVRGVFPEIDLVRLERQRQGEVRESALLRAALPRHDQAIGEAQSRRDSATQKFKASAQEDLAKAVGDIAVIEETLRAAEDKVRRATLRAPVNGVINAIPVTTIGAVVQPGKNVIEIVPVDDTLLIETRLKPQDIAFIAAGQKASVKVTAYDYTIYGGMTGTVERVAADTKFDDKGNPYYEVIVRTDSNILGPKDNPLQIIPGMVTRVDVQTGRKTVLQYIMKPVTRMRSEALRER